MHFVSNKLRETNCKIILTCRKQNTQFVILVGNLMKWFDEFNLGSLDSFRVTKKWQKNH